METNSGLKAEERTRPFIVANIRKVIVDFNNAEISFSRMVEILNETSFAFHASKQKEIDKGVNTKCEHEYITDADWKSLTCRKCNHRIKPKDERTLVRLAHDYSKQKEIDSKQDANQCDGCNAGQPVDSQNMHRMSEGEYPDYMICQKNKYAGSQLDQAKFVKKEIDWELLKYKLLHKFRMDISERNALTITKLTFILDWLKSELNK